MNGGKDSTQSPVDLFIIGGGINGCGIARDASGRGLSVTLAEMNDLASATSSAATKLFHGGLRYLEYFEFRLVREALIEREVLMRAMPHISWPMRFVLPYHPDQRFEKSTPTSHLLTKIMPWMKGRRPAWLIRFGLFLYDSLGKRQILPGTRSLKLATAPEGAPLQDRFAKAYEYSDAWVQDARLVVLNARDAEARGAQILTRTKVVKAERKDGLWHIETEDSETGARRSHQAKMMVNAAGPWVAEVIHGMMRQNSAESVRLVRGSHIVTRKLYDHDKCYFFQGEDGRIIFAIPYEEDFTLIGTTDADHSDPGQRPECSPEEEQYLVDFANRYFHKQISREDVVWRYSGVRPLYDDGASSAQAATRDYVLRVDQTGGVPVLNIFGGKITTYRRLAESAMEEISAHFPDLPGPWTAGATLPGGDFAVDGAKALEQSIEAKYSFLPKGMARRLVKHYGTEAFDILGDAQKLEDLGRQFGATLSEAEVRWLIHKEYARTAQDIVWRRTKLGLRLTAQEIEALQSYLDSSLDTGLDSALVPSLDTGLEAETIPEQAES